MISADEARALVDQSEAKTNAILQLIEEEIRKKAGDGKNVLIIAQPDVSSAMLLKFFERPLRETSFTEKQFGVVTKLREAGFSVMIARRVGTTLNDEFEQVEFTEFVPQIVW